MRFIADYALWLIPPQQIAYRAYADSQDQYNHVLRQEILANQPDLFLNQHINITGFKYLSYGRTDKGHWELKNRDITVIMSRNKLAGVIESSKRQRGRFRKRGGWSDRNRGFKHAKKQNKAKAYLKTQATSA